MLLQFLLGVICWQADAIDLYGSGFKISSFATELGYRSANSTGSSHTKLAMNNPWYMTKADNPQFGYDVTLIRSTDHNGKIAGEIVVSSAPGNPSLEFTDPGYAEIQNLDNLPESASATSKNVIIFMPDSLRKYMAHTMFGTSLLVATSVTKHSSLRFPVNTMYLGAPEGANCENKEPLGTDSLSMDSYGKLYSFRTWYNDESETLYCEEFTASYKIPDSACFTGQFFNDIGGGTQQGFNQANRNMYGFSSHISKDGKFLLLGAPMFQQQAGYVNIKHRDSLTVQIFLEYQEAYDIKYCFLCEPDKLKYYQLYDSEEGKKVGLDSFICDVDLTFGYSFTSLQIGPDEYLATGGPRSQGIHGEIKIFKFTPSQKFIVNSFSFLNPVVGRNFNTGFGTTILGADLDGDGIDELIVGEPYKTDDTTSTFNSGVVSIYQYNNGNYNFVYKLKSPFPSETNLFGFKVACLGDADADGGEDILISALREAHSGGTGKVYLYSGRSISSIYTVISRSKEYPEAIQSFEEANSELYGFSVGDEKTDLDGNGFFDLVVGDPGKSSQKAHVYYAKTVIRVLFPDKIPARLLYEELVLDKTNCPVTNQDGVNFCQPITITLENRGIMRNDPLYPENAPVLTKWEFEEDFTVSVKLSNRKFDRCKMHIFEESKEAVLGPSKDSANLTFWIYGVDVPGVYGTGMHLVAETALKSPSQLKLKGSSGFKAETVLAPSTFKDIDIAISPVANVRMEVRPKHPVMQLGSLTKTLTSKIFLNTISGEHENFVYGELEIKLGSTVIAFTSAYSQPEGLATCRREGVFVNCKFDENKKFDKAKLTIIFSATGLVDGLSEQTKFPIRYKLTWANREEDSRFLSVLVPLKVKYFAKLDVIGQSGSVAANAQFSNSRGGNTIDYSVVLKNEGESQVRKTDVSIYAPFDPHLFYITVSGKQTCFPKGYSPDYKDKCSYSQCQLFACSIATLGGLGKEIFSVTAKFSDSTFWKKIVTQQEVFTFTAEWKVVEPASYKTNLDNMYPENSEGTVGEQNDAGYKRKSTVIMGTVVTAEESAFPWWVVVVTLLVSIAIMSIIIIVLHRKGFFTKKDPKLTHKDETTEDEFVEPDQKLHKLTLSSA